MWAVYMVCVGGVWPLLLIKRLAHVISAAKLGQHLSKVIGGRGGGKKQALSEAFDVE